MVNKNNFNTFISLDIFKYELNKLLLFAYL